MHIPSLRQLKRSIKIRERIEKLQSNLSSIFEGMAHAVISEASKPKRKKRKMSAAGRARIAAAQKARWAKVKGTAPVETAKKADSKKKGSRIAVVKTAKPKKRRSKKR